MIDDVLVFLKNRLNNALNTGQDPAESLENQVVFLDGQSAESLTFKLGAVTALLVNIEEETMLRPADPYVRIAPNGIRERINPDIRLNLYVLFVARYTRYEDALRYLSHIIRYFQSHRIIEQADAPELSDEISKLVIELITLPFGEQNDIWGSLRVHYQPSVLYKVKMVIFRDEDAAPITPTTEKELKTSQ